MEDMAALTAAEEKRLGVNSPEFIRRHNEIMAMADDIQSRYKKILLPVPQIPIGASNPITLQNRVCGNYNISPARSKERIRKLIQETLNKAAAIELFEKEAVLFGTSDAVPFYRAIELFGESAATFFDRTIKFEGYLDGGADWNAWGACTDDRPMTNYLYKAGFLKLVTEHNYLCVIKAHAESEGGRIFDKCWEERSRRLEEREAEEERKRAERKAKRAATKAEREAAKKEQEGEQ